MPDPIVRSVQAPPMDPGSPRPSIAAAGDTLSLAYFGPDDRRSSITFAAPLVHYFGPPDNETLHAHPMAAFGLGRGGAFEVRNSRWVDELRDMNRTHPNHDGARFDRLRHFIWTFRDHTFECLAEGFEVLGRV